MKARYFVLEPCSDNLWSMTLHGTTREALAQINEAGGLLVQPVRLTMAPRRRRRSIRRQDIGSSRNGHAAGKAGGHM